MLYIEFKEMVDAYILAEERRQLIEDKRAAFIVANIVNVWSKRKVKPEDFTKEREQELERRYRKPITKAEGERRLAALKEKLGAGKEVE